jgi:hypothetical protein
MDMTFKKPREVFTQDELMYNNLFQFSHNCHILGDTSICIDPYFQQSDPFFMADSSEL